MHYLRDIPLAVWETLGAMAPFLLFGFLVAGVLSVYVSAETVERHLGGSGRLLGALKAALFGVPLPLCSCGVIPVAASLRRHGAGKGATTSFLISTPQTGVDSILATYSMLGPVFAVFRPLVALLSGLAGGVLVGFAEAADSTSGASGPAPACEDECCVVKPREGKLVRALRYGFVTLPRDLWKALLVGLVVAGTLSALVPRDFFAEYLGGGGVGRQLLAMAVMMAVGLPIYVCATASIPLAVAFIHLGFSPGAALVFLTTGPATNAATLAVVWKTMGRRTTVIYLATVAASAFAAGLALDYLVGLSGMPVHDALHEHSGHALLPGWAGPAAGVVLLGVLAFAALWPRMRDTSALDGGTDMTTLRISGMTCSHCAASVTRALKEVRGVEDATVSLEDGSAVVIGKDVPVTELVRAVKELGYEVTGTEARALEKDGGDGGKDEHQGHAH